MNKLIKAFHFIISAVFSVKMLVLLSAAFVMWPVTLTHPSKPEVAGLVSWLLWLVWLVIRQSQAQPARPWLHHRLPSVLFLYFYLVFLWPFQCRQFANSRMFSLKEEPPTSRLLAENQPYKIRASDLVCQVSSQQHRSTNTPRNL